ncbi:MAG: hypothetical protein MR051_00125 [Lentisphaeria bacterium]|nr:hypothetical protein [Lentisphaeria bacterium]
MNHRFLCCAAAAAVLTANAAGPIVRPEVGNGEPRGLMIEANNPEDFNRLPTETATVTFTGNPEDIRVVVDMTDADVLSESASDQTLLQKTGDAVQIFISPENDTRIWELLVDAANRKSCFFHWGPGRMFYPPATDAPPVKITAVAVKTAAGWKAEVRFPAAAVIKQYKLPADVKWTVLAVRYNYGRNLDRREISCFPQAVRTLSDPARFARLISGKGTETTR